MDVQVNTCFVLMPFSDTFTIVYETIVSALDGVMECRRADDLPVAHLILERVLTGIRSAELIIADLTGRNPNVFYELGLSHVQTKNVLLLTRDINDVPFDLRSLFCHVYSVDSMSGLDALKKTVKAAAIAVRSRNTPTVFDGAVDRTAQIIRYFDRILALPRASSMPIIRIQAGFTSLANERFLDSEDEEERAYSALLEEERNKLISLLERGAKLQAIIRPPSGPAWSGKHGQRWLRRFDMLLKFVDGSPHLWPRWEMVVSTQDSANLLFIGDEILFEGHKTSNEAGYGWTFAHLDRSYIHARLKVYDRLFQACKEYTINSFGEDNKTYGPDDLRAAVLRAIVSARDQSVKASC
jgi:hypothetical protein